MTTTDDLRDTILDVVRTIAPDADVEGLGPRTDMRDHLDLDSFDFLNVLVELSARTGVDIPEGDYAEVATLDDCIAYIEARTAA